MKNFIDAVAARGGIKVASASALEALRRSPLIFDDDKEEFDEEYRLGKTGPEDDTEPESSDKEEEEVAPLEAEIIADAMQASMQQEHAKDVAEFASKETAEVSSSSSEESSDDENETLTERLERKQ